MGEIPRYRIKGHARMAYDKVGTAVVIQKRGLERPDFDVDALVVQRQRCRVLERRRKVKFRIAALHDEIAVVPSTQNAEDRGRERCLDEGVEPS